MISLLFWTVWISDSMCRITDSEDREFKLENPACSEIAGNILCFGCSLVPRDNNGNIDELHLYPYIKELRSLAKEEKRTKATDRVIGFILGDIPLDDKYPPEYLCEKTWCST